MNAASYFWGALMVVAAIAFVFQLARAISPDPCPECPGIYYCPEALAAIKSAEQTTSSKAHGNAQSLRVQP